MSEHGTGASEAPVAPLSNRSSICDESPGIFPPSHRDRHKAWAIMQIHGTERVAQMIAEHENQRADDGDDSALSGVSTCTSACSSASEVDVLIDRPLGVASPSPPPKAAVSAASVEGVGDSAGAAAGGSSPRDAAAATEPVRGERGGARAQNNSTTVGRGEEEPPLQPPGTITNDTTATPVQTVATRLVLVVVEDQARWVATATVGSSSAGPLVGSGATAIAGPPAALAKEGVASFPVFGGSGSGCVSGGARSFAASPSRSSPLPPREIFPKLRRSRWRRPSPPSGALPPGVCELPRSTASGRGGCTPTVFIASATPSVAVAAAHASFFATQRGQCHFSGSASRSAMCRHRAAWYARGQKSQQSKSPPPPHTSHSSRFPSSAAAALGTDEPPHSAAASADAPLATGTTCGALRAGALSSRSAEVIGAVGGAAMSAADDCAGAEASVVFDVAAPSAAARPASQEALALPPAAAFAVATPVFVVLSLLRRSVVVAPFFVALGAAVPDGDRSPCHQRCAT